MRPFVLENGKPRILKDNDVIELPNSVVKVNDVEYDLKNIHKVKLTEDDDFGYLIDKLDPEFFEFDETNKQIKIKNINASSINNIPLENFVTIEDIYSIQPNSFICFDAIENKWKAKTLSDIMLETPPLPVDSDDIVISVVGNSYIKITWPVVPNQSYDVYLNNDLIEKSNKTGTVIFNSLTEMLHHIEVKIISKNSIGYSQPAFKSKFITGYANNSINIPTIKSNKVTVEAPDKDYFVYYNIDVININTNETNTLIKYKELFDIINLDPDSFYLLKCTPFSHNQSEYIKLSYSNNVLVKTNATQPIKGDDFSIINYNGNQLVLTNLMNDYSLCIDYDNNEYFVNDFNIISIPLNVNSGTHYVNVYKYKEHYSIPIVSYDNSYVSHKSDVYALNLPGFKNLQNFDYSINNMSLILSWTSDIDNNANIIKVNEDVYSLPVSTTNLHIINNNYGDIINISYKTNRNFDFGLMETIDNTMSVLFYKPILDADINKTSITSSSFTLSWDIYSTNLGITYLLDDGYNTYSVINNAIHFENINRTSYDYSILFYQKKNDLLSKPTHISVPVNLEKVKLDLTNCYVSSSGGFNIKWHKPNYVDYHFDYHIYVNDIEHDTVSGNYNSYYFDDITDNTDYVLKVKLVGPDGRESDFSDEISYHCFLDKGSVRPSYINIENLTDHSVKLSWNELTDATYNVYNDYSLLIDNLTTNSYSIINLNSGSFYNFYIGTVYDNTEIYRTPVSVITKPTAVDDTSIIYVHNGINGLKFSFNYNYDYDYFKIYKSSQILYDNVTSKEFYLINNYHNNDTIGISVVKNNIESDITYVNLELNTSLNYLSIACVPETPSKINLGFNGINCDSYNIYCNGSYQINTTETSYDLDLDYETEYTITITPVKDGIEYAGWTRTIKTLEEKLSLSVKDDSDDLKDPEFYIVRNNKSISAESDHVTCYINGVLLTPENITYTQENDNTLIATIKRDVFSTEIKEILFKCFTDGVETRSNELAFNIKPNYLFDFTVDMYDYDNHMVDLSWGVVPEIMMNNVTYSIYINNTFVKCTTELFDTVSIPITNDDITFKVVATCPGYDGTVFDNGGFEIQFNGKKPIENVTFSNLDIDEVDITWDHDTSVNNYVVLVNDAIYAITSSNTIRLKRLKGNAEYNVTVKDFDKINMFRSNVCTFTTPIQPIDDVNLRLCNSNEIYVDFMDNSNEEVTKYKLYINNNPVYSIIVNSTSQLRFTVPISILDPYTDNESYIVAIDDNGIESSKFVFDLQTEPENINFNSLTFTYAEDLMLLSYFTLDFSYDYDDVDYFIIKIYTTDTVDGQVIEKDLIVKYKINNAHIIDIPVDTIDNYKNTTVKLKITAYNELYSKDYEYVVFIV